jgi:L-aspartate oxidase
MVKKFDFLVIGSGIAGMSFALKVAGHGKVALVCKTTLEDANTYFAQGGVASVTNNLVDNFEKHIEDTMIAGDWISDRDAVEKVVREAPSQIQALIDWGVEFDRNENGEFDLHKEGGHSEFRILHHKDNTGAEIQTSLIKAVKAHPNITVFTHFYAVEIITQHHLGIIVTRHNPGIKCYGAYVLNEETGEVVRDKEYKKVTILIDDNGKSYVTGSKMFTNQMMRYINMFGIGEFEDGLVIKIIEKSVKNSGNKALGFELVD